MSERFVQGGSGALRVDDRDGDAPAGALPLVLVHGMAVDARVWDPAREALRRGGDTRRTTALELRGHGGSATPPDGDHGIEAGAGDVLAVLDALGLERVALVGHSYGAHVALATAARAPARVARLVLADPPGDFTQLPPAVRREQLEPYVAALAGEGWREAAASDFEEALAGARPATRDAVLDGLGRTSHGCLLSMMHSMFAFPAVAALDAYAAGGGARVHVVLAPSNVWPFGLHLLRPTLAQTVLPDTSHWVQLDAPDAFATALRRALGAED